MAVWDHDGERQHDVAAQRADGALKSTEKSGRQPPPSTHEVPWARFGMCVTTARASHGWYRAVRTGIMCTNKRRRVIGQLHTRASRRRGAAALPHVCLVLGSTHERTATTPNRREVCLETARDERTRVEGGGEVLDMKLANQTYVRC